MLLILVSKSGTLYVLVPCIASRLKSAMLSRHKQDLPANVKHTGHCQDQGIPKATLHLIIPGMLSGTG